MSDPSLTNPSASTPAPALDADLAALLAELQQIAAATADEHVRVCARQAMLMVHAVQDARVARAASAEHLQLLRDQAERDSKPIERPTPLERIAASVEAIAAKLGAEPMPAPPPGGPPPTDPPAPNPTPVPAPMPPVCRDRELVRRVAIALAPSTFGAEKLRERVQEVLDVIAQFSGEPVPVPVPPPVVDPGPSPVPPPSHPIASGSTQ